MSTTGLYRKDGTQNSGNGGTIGSDIRSGVRGARKALVWLIITAAFVYVLSGFYVIQPEERGVVLRFGALERNMVPSGIHYHYPYPVEKCFRVKVSEIKRVAVGFNIEGQAPAVAGEKEVLTGDENVINVELLVQYSISDPAAFLFSVVKPQELINKSARAALTSISGSMGVDEILTTSKPIIQRKVKERVQEELDHYHTGVTILASHLQSVRPPQAVSDAFMDVSSAKEDRERYINEAEGYRNNIVPQAQGEARSKIRQAEAYRTEVISKAQGDADRFLALLDEYPEHKDITKMRLYIETMEEILPKMNKYIVNDDADAKADGKGSVQIRYIEPVKR